MSNLQLNSFNLHKILQELTSSNDFYIAYSGGVDSQVLLYLLSAVKLDHPEINIAAIHIDHGLSENSSVWANHCLVFCKQLQIDCIVKKIDVKGAFTKKHSREALARDLRYRAIDEIIGNHKGASLLTAHHADDQAETLLLQLFRGAGPRGLAAIPPASFLSPEIKLLRPLLAFSREEILKFAQQNNLMWTEDESNLDLQMDRNYVRHKLIPIIKNRWPKVLKTIGRSVENFVEASDLLDYFASKDLIEVQGSVQSTLSVAKLLQLDSARQRNVIRYWIRTLNLSLPSREKLREVQKISLAAAEDKNPLISWDGVEVRRFQNNLYAEKPLIHFDTATILPWNLQNSLKLPEDLGTLQVKSELQDLKKIDTSNISVRFRQGGEKCKISGRGNHSHTLKNLFQEWQVSPWQRDRIPLLYFEDELICVVGFCTAPGWEFLKIEHIF